MTFNHKITPDSGTFYYGTDEGLSKLREKALSVAFPQESIDFMYVVEVDGEFRTYGPVGGNNTAYHAIDWAYRNVAAFGLQIDRFGEKSYPVLLLSSHRALKQLLADMNAQQNAKA